MNTNRTIKTMQAKGRTMALSLFSLFAILPMTAQTATQVLDKTASVVSAKSGAQASFTIKGEYMNASGTISIKGRKFHAATTQATIWFDGKTQWTYLKKNDEVNVTNPTESQVQAINPYNFIYMYKNGYTTTMNKKGNSYEVHLTATDTKRSIKEMYIVVSQKSYAPSQIRMRQQKGWTTIDIRDFRKVSLGDDVFRFNAKDFPSAEIIDLR